MSGPFDSVIIGMVEGGLVGGAVAFYMAYKGSKIDPTVALAQKPANLVTFTAAIPPEEALQAILEYARAARLEIYNIDPALGRVILGEKIRMTSFHNGYWLPVYITGSGVGITTIEVGIKPKVLPTATLSLYRNKAVNGIKAALQKHAQAVLLRASQTPDPAPFDLPRPSASYPPPGPESLLRSDGREEEG